MGEDPPAWGWEFPISPSGCRYPGLAVDESDGTLHVVWTQYNATFNTLEVAYCEGRSVPAVIASDTDWMHRVFLDGTVTVAAGATLRIWSGTTVYAQTPEQMPGTGLVGIRVEGRLDAGDVRFTTTKDSTSGEWDGIRFDLPGCARPGTMEAVIAPGAEGRWVVEVFDVAGRRVATPYAGVSSAGVHRVSWSGGSSPGRSVGSGIYFVRMRGPSFTATKKVLLVR